MNKNIYRITFFFYCFMALFIIQTNAQDTIAVLSYNILNFPNPSNSNSLGDDVVRVIYFREIVEASNADIILVQELKTDQGANLLLNELNDNNTNGKIFARASMFFAYGPSPFQIGNMLFYNTGKFNFLSQSEVPSINTAMTENGNTVQSPRAASYYELEAYTSLCPSWLIPIHLFSMHLKAGTNAATDSEIADHDRRVLGAQDLMDFIDSGLTTSDNIIATGDLNFYSYLTNNTSNPQYDEPAYDVLMDNMLNTNSFIDQLGGWIRNNSDPINVCKYTQSTRNAAPNEFGNFGSNGGLDDRFDFILMNEAIENEVNKMSYLEESYKTFGSSKIFNSAATDGIDSLATQFHQMSDHYPVLAKFVLDIPNEILILSQQDISSGTYLAFDKIESTGSVSADSDVVFKAMNEISLGVGFCVESGGVFLAETEDVCISME